MEKDKYQDIQERVEAAAEKARADKGTKTPEEIKADFMKEAVALFDEYIAGDITLADGRVIHTPKIDEM